MGGVAGTNDNDGVIDRCIATGMVSGIRNIGKLVGSNEGTILASYTSGNIAGKPNCISIGGLVGLNGNSIQNCYSESNILATEGGNQIGGLVGTNNKEINNCYSIGSVTPNTDSGGLVGISNEGSITSSYYDTQTSGQQDTGKGDGKTTQEMMSSATYVNWDFDKTWMIEGGCSYPKFLK